MTEHVRHVTYHVDIAINTHSDSKARFIYELSILFSWVLKLPETMKGV